jgi:tRNA A-37 threonylcarbamoyl transferase component Bud32
MHTKFWIDPALKEKFRREGLGDFSAWMNAEIGEVVSSVRGSETRLVESGGECFFVKRRKSEPAMRLLALLLFGRCPMSAPLREYRMLQALVGEGFRVMVPVAWGEASSLGIPKEGFLVVRAVAGRSLLQAYREGSAEDRGHQMRQFGRLTGRLHARGFFDHLRLKDLIVEADGQLTMIDRESRHPWRRRFSERSAITTLARTARRTFRDGDRMGPKTGFEFFKGYREGVAASWQVGTGTLRRKFFEEFRKELARYPNRSQW